MLIHPEAWLVLMIHEELLDRLGREVEREVGAILDRAVSEARGYHPFIASLYESIYEYVMRGGKRLASCSALICYSGYRGVIDEVALRGAAGIELYRHAILVHDDLIDMDEERRGGPALHRVLSRGLDTRFGSMSAILAGCILYSLAFRTVSEAGGSGGGGPRAARLLATGIREVNESQVLDLLFEYREPSVDEWGVMASRRAASLFKVSMLTGAILAGAPDSEIEVLGEAAGHIGYAFDIQDDLIDTFACREDYGREPCGDIAKGKKPLHVILALGRDGGLAGLLGRGMLSPDEVEEARRAVRESGALDEARSVAKRHAEEARRLINATSMRSDSKEFYASLIDYVTESLSWYR